MITLIQIFNILIFLGLLIGIPWFMITVVRLLTKIESRLESLEKSMNSKRQDLKVHNDSILGLIKAIELTLEKDDRAGAQE
ncbi:MAG: hypothetical protein IBX70_13900 [Clostridia bacterium]|nr:hypothetical protein [Clostridia bacterium]